tara:strand:- start:45 stop:206 length:162 start_codon:yes stop_codon:yes gene_type:complete
MESGYKTKDMKAEVKKELPIYQKRQHWCFKLDGVLHKLPTKKEAEEKYLELTK